MYNHEQTKINPKHQHRLGRKIKNLQRRKLLRKHERSNRILTPYAVNENLKFKREIPAFTLIADENNKLDVSFYELRHSSAGKEWNVANEDYSETATLLFSDGQGAFIRFSNSDDQVSVMYYHYLKS